MQNRLVSFSKEGHRCCLALGTENLLKPFPGLNFVFYICGYKCNFQHLCALMFHFVNYFTVSRNNLARKLIKSTSCSWRAALRWALPLSCPQPRAAQHLQVMSKRTGAEQAEQLANSSLSERYGPTLVPLKINTSFIFDLNGSRIWAIVNSFNHMSEWVGTSLNCRIRTALLSRHNFLLISVSFPNRNYGTVNKIVKLSPSPKIKST